MGVKNVNEEIEIIIEVKRILWRAEAKKKLVKERIEV